MVCVHTGVDVLLIQVGEQEVNTGKGLRQDVAGFLPGCLSGTVTGLQPSY